MLKKLMAGLSLALVAVVTCAGLVGCKKGTDLGAYAGTWTLDSVEYAFESKEQKEKLLTGSGMSEDDFNAFMNEATNNFKEAIGNVYIKFNKDGTYSTNYVEEYETKSTSATITDVKYHDLTWTINGNNLYLAGYATYKVDGREETLTTNYFLSDNGIAVLKVDKKAKIIYGVSMMPAGDEVLEAHFNFKKSK